MKKYFVKKITDTDFKVIEKQTNFVIKSFKTHNPAQKLSIKLNDGSGFSGETPQFFVNKWDQL